MRNPVVNVVVPALALITALPVIAHAQAPEAWKVTVVPYLLGAGMSGTSAVKGQELTVEASASDIFSNLQFGAESGFPLGFQTTSHESILRLDHLEAALGPIGLIPFPFHFEAPLGERGVVVVLELAGGKDDGLDGSRSYGIKEGSGDALVNGKAADVETVHAATTDDVFAWTMVAGGGVAAAVVSAQFTAAVPAGGNALEQRAAPSLTAPPV